MEDGKRKRSCFVQFEKLDPFRIKVKAIIARSKCYRKSRLLIIRWSCKIYARSVNAKERNLHSYSESWNIVQS